MPENLLVPAIGATGEMHWASGVSERVDTQTAIKAAAAALLTGQTTAPDLVFVFISAHHADNYERVSAWVHEELGETTLVGCSGSGVIGAGQELEGREAVSLIGGWLPGIQVRVGHVAEFLPATEEEWVEFLELDATQKTDFILLADAVTCDIEVVLKTLDESFPNMVKLGGLANSGPPDQPAALFAHGDLRQGGGLVIALQGNIEIKTIVSQGCRPVGEPLIVTRCKGNVIKELNAGRPAEVLRRIYDSLNARDLARFNTSMFMGVDLGDDSRSRYGRGDFLMRNILGIDPDSGALAVDAQITTYQVVQFHMRDQEMAETELVQLLRDVVQGDPVSHVRGALMFSSFCRGERLFGVPNHDSDLFTRHLGSVPLAGFFCNGEVAPMGGKSCLHGYTSVFALFCEPKA
jgi:small ligand-binding sensory domain FIST